MTVTRTATRAYGSHVDSLGFLMAVALGFAVPLLVLVAALGITSSRSIRLLETGVPTEAEILGKSSRTFPVQRSLTYRYSAAGRTIELTRNIEMFAPKLWDRVERGDRLELRYDAASPERHHLVEEREGMGSGVYGSLVIIGLVGSPLLLCVVLGIAAWRANRILLQHGVAVPFEPVPGGGVFGPQHPLRVERPDAGTHPVQCREEPPARGGSRAPRRSAGPRPGESLPTGLV